MSDRIPETKREPLLGITLDVRERMMRFESLGESCEFGLVQRRCGAEPLGLFRFASAPLSKLLAALSADFADFGTPDAIEVQQSGREYMIRDKRFGLLYHAWVLADQMTREEVHQREVRRLPLLVRKLREDRSAAEKDLRLSRHGTARRRGRLAAGCGIKALRAEHAALGRAG